mgnify:CR=1 FL=1
MTIVLGLSILAGMEAEMAKKGETVLAGEEAFRLYDTYGFPVDLTKEILEEKGMQIDEEGFKKAMEAQRETAKGTFGEHNYMGADVTIYESIDPSVTTEFVGYDHTEYESPVTVLTTEDEIVDALSDGDRGTIFVEKTPFYATSGGQQADTGVIRTADFEFQVEDVKKLLGGKIAHVGHVARGMVKVGDTVTIEFTFPEDYDDSSIAGKKCELAVSINMIEKEVIPEVNDALVKENTDCKTVKEYKKQVRDSLVSDKKSEAEQTNQETLWNKIMDNATQLKDFSEADIKKEVSNIKIENKEMAGYFGMSVSDFIEQYYEMSLEDYAKENLKKQCVQDLLLKEKSIEITDADVDEEIQYYIDELGYKDKKEVLSAISEDEIHSELQYTKLMDALMKETTIK